MTKVLAAVGAIVLFASPASAHRLDEYLQATLLSVENNSVHASMRLIPGVAVSSAVISSIDSDADGIFSTLEQQSYGARVLRDLTLSVDGKRLHPRLISVEFPRIEEMREGLGEIQIEFTADLPSSGTNRKLTLENHHETRISAYLVNCLVPRDRDIQVIAQIRNEVQSFYELDYAQSVHIPSVANPRAYIQFWFRGVAGMFRLGIRHIAEGTDHLLFLLVLLLPAPLLVAGARWNGFAGVRQSVLRILKVVTAFTVGHSITLAIAAFGLVHVPSRPIEVLIAVSIFVSAAHSLRPLFPGREAGIAAFFGLIHGLAFAGTLGDLGLGRWERFASVLGFNLGIETMQLVVVLATMPSLVLLSRTSAYSMLRIGGAVFAGLAAVGWMVERLLGLHNSVDVVVGSVAHHSVWIAIALLVTSLICWMMRLQPKVISSARSSQLHFQ